MSGFFSIFKRKNEMGATTRNTYLDNHGYYLSQQKRKPAGANGHSIPVIPYAIYDLLTEKITKEFSVYVRWDISSYRWALHNFKHTSSCRITLKKSSRSGHRHFVRDGEKNEEELRNYSNDHRKKFELIFFDGPDKYCAVENILAMLKENGVIIITNDFNDPYDFEQALNAFKQAGFKALKIDNPAPMFDTLSGAVIYKENNFLEI